MTRLILISGTKAAMYDDRKEVHVWDTKDQQHPIDKLHYQELEPQVWSIDWLSGMMDKGRRFDAITSELAIV